MMDRDEFEDRVAIAILAASIRRGEIGRTGWPLTPEGAYTMAAALADERDKQRFKSPAPWVPKVGDRVTCPTETGDYPGVVKKVDNETRNNRQPRAWVLHDDLSIDHGWWLVSELRPAPEKPLDTAAESS